MAISISKPKRRQKQKGSFTQDDFEEVQTTTTMYVMQYPSSTPSLSPGHLEDSRHRQVHTSTLGSNASSHGATNGVEAPRLQLLDEEIAVGDQNGCTQLFHSSKSPGPGHEGVAFAPSLIPRHHNNDHCLAKAIGLNQMVWATPHSMDQLCQASWSPWAMSNSNTGQNLHPAYPPLYPGMYPYNPHMQIFGPMTSNSFVESSCTPADFSMPAFSMTRFKESDSSVLTDADQGAGSNVTNFFVPVYDALVDDNECHGDYGDMEPVPFTANDWIGRPSSSSSPCLA